MNELNETIDSMEESLRDSLGASVCTVGVHDGDVNVPMLKAYAVKSPAALIVPLGGKTSILGGTVHDTSTYEVYVLTSKRSTKDKLRQAILLREAITRWVYTLELEHVQNPSGTSTKNYYGTELDSMGLSLWSVSFDLTIELPPEESPNCGEFLTMYTEYYQPGDNPEVDETPIIQEIDVRA